MARDTEVVVDCAAVRKLLLDDCGLKRSQMVKDFSVSRSSLTRMLGANLTPPGSYAAVNRGNAEAVTRKASEILKRRIELDAIVWKGPTEPSREPTRRALVVASSLAASVPARALLPAVASSSALFEGMPAPELAAIGCDRIVATGPALRRGPLNWHLPRAPEPYVEPVDDLKKLLSALGPGGSAGTPEARSVGLVGMGGIGKTVLAAALARDPRALRIFAHGVVWLSFGQGGELLAKQDELLMAISGVRHASRNINEAHGALCLLTELLPGRLLVVLDDVWTLEGVRTAFGDLPNVEVLITSRDRRVVEAFGATPLELGLLSPDAALTFLAATTGCDRADLPSESGDVIRRCGRLPIALAAAGSLIRRDQYTWPEIVEALVQARLHEFESKWLDEPLKRDLAAVLKVSVDALSDQHRDCLLDFAVFQEDVAVPEAALVNLWSGSRRPRPVARTVARELADRSLLQIDGERRYRIHDLYRDYLRDLVQPLQVRHASLAQRYAACCPGAWSGGPDDGYFFQFVVRHRAAAGDDVAAQVYEADWLMAKLPAAGLGSMIADFSLCDDPDGERIIAALRLSAERLAQDELCLPVQLCGRLVGDPPSRLVSLLGVLRRMVSDAMLMPLDDGFLDQPGRLERILSGHSSIINGIAVSSDGRFGLTASEDRTVILWNLETGRIVRRLEGHAQGVNAAAFLEHRNALMSADEAGDVIVWSQHADGPQRQDAAGPGSIDRILVLPDGWRAVLAGAAGGLVLWDVAEGRIVRRFGDEHGRVTVLNGLPDGSVLAGDDRGSVCMWEPVGGRMIRAYSGHRDRIRALACSRGEVWAAAEGGTILGWDAATGLELSRATGARIEGQGAAFLADGRTFASGLDDGSLVLWDVREARATDRIEAHGHILSVVEPMPDGVRFLTGSHDETVRLWNPTAPASRPVGRNCGSPIQAVGATTDGSWIVTGSEDGSVHIWRGPQAEIVDCVPGREGAARALAVLDDRLCVYGGDDGVLRVWDFRARQMLCELPTRAGRINRMLAVDGTHVLVGSIGGALSLWNVDGRSGASLTLQHDSTVTALKLMPGRRAASGDGRGVIRIWDLATGDPLHVMSGHGSSVQGLAVLDGADRLASGSSDGEMRLWDLRDGNWRPIAEGGFARGRGRSRDLAPAVIEMQTLGNTDRVVIATGDNILGIWSISEDREVASFHDDHQIVAMAPAAFGRQLFVGNLGGRIHRFDTSAFVDGAAIGPSGP